MKIRIKELGCKTYSEVINILIVKNELKEGENKR